MGEKYEKTKQYRRFSKISETLEYFHVSFLEEKNCLDIDYENSIIPLGGFYPLEEQIVVLPLLLLYTNFSCYTLQSQKYVSEEIYENLCIEKQNLGNAIRKMCICNFKKRIITPTKVQKIKDFLSWAKPQLYHIAGKIGEYSEEIIPKEAEMLKEIREVYESFQIDDNSIDFYDEILKKTIKISIDSSQTGYAIAMLFCEAYTISIPWLKQYSPNG